MSKECKCTNPDGGGTKCPVQHVAICIRGKDKECYGECVAIPTNYTSTTRGFNQWLQNSIKDVVGIYADENYPDTIRFSPLTISTQSDLLDGGRIIFRVGNINIHVRFSYEFRNDIEPLSGLLEVSIT